MKGFKDFLMQGNVVELAVAVIIGGAFGKIVDAVVKFLMDIIGAIGGQPNFDQVGVAITDDKTLYYGPVITAVIGFVTIAAVVYFVIVKPYETIRARAAAGRPAEEPAPDPQLELLKEIRDSIRERG